MKERYTVTIYKDENDNLYHWKNEVGASMQGYNTIKEAETACMDLYEANGMEMPYIFFYQF